MRPAKWPWTATEVGHCGECKRGKHVRAAQPHACTRCMHPCARRARAHPHPHAHAYKGLARTWLGRMAASARFRRADDASRLPERAALHAPARRRCYHIPYCTWQRVATCVAAWTTAWRARRASHPICCIELTCAQLGDRLGMEILTGAHGVSRCGLWGLWGSLSCEMWHVRFPLRPVHRVCAVRGRRCAMAWRHRQRSSSFELGSAASPTASRVPSGFLVWPARPRRPAQ